MRILIAEDERITRRSLERSLEQWGHRVVSVEDGEQAWEKMQSEEFDAVLTDWQMPGMSGIELVQRIRSLKLPHYVYIILLTSKSDTKDVVAGLEQGADDFLRKPFERDELRARLNSGERIVALERELARHNARMKTDLNAAYDYVLSLFPAPLETPIALSWRYQPATELAGDSLGYHWLNDSTCAMYVLDVTGHGLDAALLSVTVLNAIRRMSLPNTDFACPGEVVAALNDMFPMEAHGDKCFSLWYGVYDRQSRTLRWAGGGHPPALYFASNDDRGPIELPSTGPLLGIMQGLEFGEQMKSVSQGDRLMIYSDGVYEITRPDGTMWTYDEFVRFSAEHAQEWDRIGEELLTNARLLRGDDLLEDDFTLVMATL